MTTAMRKATHARHYQDQPQKIDADGSKHWITRAANFVADVTEAKPGASLPRTQQADEYMAFVISGRATVEAGSERSNVEPETLVIMPPGPSMISMPDGGEIIRIFSNKATDMTGTAVNAVNYADALAEVTPITPWPDPVGGFGIRSYRLADYKSPDPGPLKMRVFRSTNLMINIFEPWSSRRDPAKLSPHWHDDFEQMSFGLRGAFRHHLRYPWGADMSKWEDDEHVTYEASPSMLVIPAGVIHTTQDIGDGTTWLVDIFGPPRIDLSLKPGFVLNEMDYPMPLRGA
jgi:quercetin dioxygenase-like cupin family protein